MAEEKRAIEAAGEDVDAAIASGLAELDVGRDAVEVEVLDEGSGGLLGLGAREARVRLTLKPRPAAEPSEPAPSPAEPSEAAPPAAEPGEAAPSRPAEVDVAPDALLELLTLLGIEHARVDVRRAEPEPGEGEPPLVLNADGEGADALIGSRGKTLAALQYITRLIVGQELQSRANLVVDVQGFKARRAKSLRLLAERLAKQATRTGRRVVMEPMPPHERRVIHLALRDDPNVTTESIGEGDGRKVTIIPQRR